MKRFFVGLLLVVFSASLVSAQLLIGAKAGGMGGAGVANVTDLAASYYNPAALMRSNLKAAEVKVSLGAEYTDPTDVLNALGKANDPASFIADNYAKSLSFTGNVDGVVGVNVKKVGISILPQLSSTVSKNANSLVSSMSISGQYDTVVTLGKTFNLSFLPASVDVGVNGKYITAYSSSITTTGTATSASGTKTYGSGTGYGFDVGALTTFNVPYVTELKVGVVARNLLQSVTYSNKSQNYYLNYNGSTATVTSDAETALPDSTTTVDPTWAVGASGLVPAINLLVAGDLEYTTSGTNSHIGVQYPLLMNLVLLRAGTANGNNLAKNTIGAKINFPFFTLDAVIVSDAKNSSAKSYILDINMGW